MNTSKLILPVILFLLTLASGFWVSRSGKPFNGAIFALHKLLALAAVVFTVIALVNLLKATPIQTFTVGLMIVAGISVVALIATGGLMSAQKELNILWVWVHRVAILLLGGSAVTLFIRLIGK